MSNDSIAVIQNFQMIKSNKTYTLRESLKGFAKDKMRLHELSRLSERDNQSMFFTRKKITKKRKKCHEHCILGDQITLKSS